MSGGEPFQCSSSSSGKPSLTTPFPCQQTLTAAIRLWALKSEQRILSPAFLLRSTCAHRVGTHAEQIKILGRGTTAAYFWDVCSQFTVLRLQITYTSYGDIYTLHWSKTSKGNAKQ
jgi:hypothetical protein